MNRPHLPPFHLIVGFEAAARLRSFKKAAEELALTPSAVSQRVRSLEERLGIRLFERVVRGIELTSDGTRYHEQVRRILCDLAEATQSLTSTRLNHFSLAMTSVVAQEMVIPNLGRIAARGPEITVDVLTRNSMKTFSPDDSDAGIRIGAGAWPGFEDRTIGSLASVPLCAPALVNRIRDWDDVFAHTLFCAKSRETETLASLIHPATGRCHARVVGFQTLAEAVRAAEAGLGVVGGIMPLMNNLVRQRRLAAAFEETRPMNERIVFIFRPDHPKRDELDGIYAWLADCYRGLPPLETPGGNYLRACS